MSNKIQIKQVTPYANIRYQPNVSSRQHYTIEQQLIKAIIFCFLIYKPQRSAYIYSQHPLSLFLRPNCCLPCLSSIILLMGLKRSQEFLYFQDKARHYANLRNAKSTLKTYRHSFTLTPSDHHTLPYFKRYQLENQNEGLINRITQITTGPKLQIEKQGYTRYNHHFVPKSSFAIQQKKTDDHIYQTNRQIANKVLKAKPSIGSVESWDQSFQANRSIRNNISKYTSKRTSKATLQVYASNKFMPQHYRSFLNGPLKRKIEQESPEDLPISIKIRADQLFQLPKLKKLRGSLTRIGENGEKVEYF